MTVSTIKMTAKQFLQLGEDPPGVRLELVDGEVAVSPSPTPDHSNVITELTFMLMKHVKARRLGKIYADVDTIFGEHDIRRPDIAFFATDRLHLIGRKALEGPPDLCVEVISPGSVTIDRKTKFQQYEKAGVAHYWIADPLKKTLEGFTLIGEDYQSAGGGKNDDVIALPPFPDLQITLTELWQFP